ncbi:MAG: hypothetical protein HYS18_12640 [Burkholderiales bacterium]|nr:hypothetical protein [Burkholderiales bacterium]
MKPHKNKVLATFLAAIGGAVGLHRFYLHGWKDRWGWLHLASLPLSGLAIRLWFGQPLLFTASPLVISFLAALIEALVIGLTPDERWDRSHNIESGKASASGWPLAVLLVLITGCGAVALIAVLARTLDLLFTGGAYG